MSDAPPRIKLGAIARNEGAYLVDWVHHHLRAGFDAVEVWVNGTDDDSVAILERLGEVTGRVSFRVVDGLLADSLVRGKSFQLRAYRRMGRAAARAGFTHIAFLDLDEYWTTRDLTGRIGDFVPEGDRVNVVSFPWCLDVPDPATPAFAHPLLRPAPLLQRDPHVKSLVRLDERVSQLRTHTARTTDGVRLLVRDAFPLPQPRAQQWGSVVTHAELARTWDRLPEAFVWHALHRSPVEYVASLDRGLRQTGRDLRYKTNRPGFLASGAPRLPFAPPGPALASYARDLEAFRERVGAEALTAHSQALVLERAEAIRSAVLSSPEVLEELRRPLSGMPFPELDERAPGWDAHLVVHVDSVLESDSGPVVDGWAFDSGGAPVQFALERGSGDVAPIEVTLHARPDVGHVHPGAPLECGFRVRGPRDLDLAGATLLARRDGGGVWERRPLRGLVRAARSVRH